MVFLLLTLVIFVPLWVLPYAFTSSYVFCIRVICLRCLIGNQESEHVLDLFYPSPMSCSRLAGCALVYIEAEYTPGIILPGMVIVLYIFDYMPKPYLLVSWA